jgi:hypothetical protein
MSRKPKIEAARNSFVVRAMKCKAGAASDPEGKF